MARSIGFYAAATVALLCVAGVGVILVRAITAEPATPGTGGFDGAPGVFGPEGSVDIRQAPISGAKGLHIQVMDKDDRDRLAAELHSQTLEPQGAQRYGVTEPRATLYLENNRTVTMESRTGTMMMPDRSDAPESGTLNGEVVIRVYDPIPDGDRVDHATAAPTMVWTGETLSFDSTLGEVLTNQPFVLTTDEFEFRAADAKILINQTLDRLERFTVRRGGSIRALAAADRTETETEPTAQAEPRAPREPRAGGPRPTPAPPVVTFYQAAMRGEIALAMGAQSIRSDRLDLFARTLDNKLPKGAIGEFAGPSTAATVSASETPTEPATSPAGAGRQRRAPTPTDDTPRDATASAETPPDAATQPESDSDPDSDPDPTEMTLTWAGTLEITPLADRPPELQTDDLFARFTSAQSGLVIAEDTASGSTLKTAVIEHALTSQVLVASGPGQRSVEFSSADRGVARMGHFVLPLRTGVAPIAGPGEFIAPDGGRVHWTTRAELLFHVAEGRVVGELREALCVGGAEASNNGASIQADTLHAVFDDRIDGASALVRLDADGRAGINDGNGGGGPAERFSIMFARDENGATIPTTFEASGRANLRQPGAFLKAEHVYAVLAQTPDGDTEVSKAWADGSIDLERFEDGVRIRGERLYADLATELLEVEGLSETEEGAAPVLASVRRGSTQIDGEVVHLRGANGEAEVRGAGAFEHRAGKGATASHVLARWTGGMAYDDRAGTLVAVGGVHAINEPDPLSRDVIDAEIVRVNLAPLGEAATTADAGDAAPASTDFVGDREVLRVYAAGGQLLGMADTLATIESARFAPGGGTDPALERAFRLSGVEIISDNTAGTIDVPGRGRLFVADLRADTGASTATEDDRGAALFDWTGSFHADRTAGNARMLESVQMSHTRAADGAKTLLECADLAVTFAPQTGDPMAVGGLRSAVATQSVYLRSNGRELTSHVLHYAPDIGVARALAGEGARVRMLDSAGSPTSASAIVWDLNTDRVDIVDPGTIVIPRID